MQGGDEDGAQCAHVGRDGGGGGDDRDKGGGEYSGEHAVEMRRVRGGSCCGDNISEMISRIDSELHSCRDSLTFASLLKMTSQTL